MSFLSFSITDHMRNQHGILLKLSPICCSSSYLDYLIFFFLFRCRRMENDLREEPQTEEIILLHAFAMKAEKKYEMVSHELKPPIADHSNGCHVEFHIWSALEKDAMPFP